MALAENKKESEAHIIDVRHVSKWFGEKQVLNDVNLYVRKGEFVTILGPSGCGKTTLLRILAGFHMATDGEILLEGKDIAQTPPYKRPMNTVFQRYALFPHLNVYDNVAFGLKLRKMDSKEMDAAVRKALKMVGMTDYEERDVNSLSGGQQQRVAIARAIVNKPQVLLLDEPLAALDLKMRKDMQLELKDMHKTLGITFIYVTHDQEEALTLSDTIVVMNEGVIQQIGTPTDIYNEPKNCFVADFIGESNILEGTMLKDCLVRFMDKEFNCVDTGFDENEPVDVVLRPEDIYIMQRNEQAEQFHGIVQSCIFKGVHYEMIVLTPDGYEIMIQDYNSFEPGTDVSLIVKPADIHVMKKERLCNTIEATVVDSEHIEMLGEKFQILPTDIEAGTEVVAEVGFDKIDLMDYQEDGTADGEVRLIIYKGNHYHLTIATDEGPYLYVDTNDVWDDGDLVGINIKPEDIKLKVKG
ncbi:MAG: polyamine ABC transporter ATP-binding protein [Bacteroidaceae bacterium]|nr:polyamine ABC transporter ATP-binding protein [Bacteroidaceae bacterium]